MVRQVAQHPGQVHFRFSDLEATLHRGLDPFLGRGIAHALTKEIGIATEVLRRREYDRIDPVLDRELIRGGKAGDPMREPPLL